MPLSKGRNAGVAAVAVSCGHQGIEISADAMMPKLSAFTAKNYGFLTLFSKPMPIIELGRLTAESNHGSNEQDPDTNRAFSGQKGRILS